MRRFIISFVSVVHELIKYVHIMSDLTKMAMGYIIIIINTIVKKCLIQRLLMMDFMKQIMDLVMHLVQQKKLLHPELYLAHTVANRRIYGIS